MGLDVWFREDVARALRAAQVAGREAQTGMESEDVPYTEDREVVLSREMAAYLLEPPTVNRGLVPPSA